MATHPSTEYRGYYVWPTTTKNPDGTWSASAGVTRVVDWNPHLPDAPQYLCGVAEGFPSEKEALKAVTQEAFGMVDRGEIPQ